MSRGKIFALILVIGVIILLAAIMESCRSGSYPLEQEEFEEGSTTKIEKRRQWRAHTLSFQSTNGEADFLLKG